MMKIVSRTLLREYWGKGPLDRNEKISHNIRRLPETTPVGEKGSKKKDRKGRFREDSWGDLLRNKESMLVKKLPSAEKNPKLDILGMGRILGEKKKRTL